MVNYFYFFRIVRMATDEEKILWLERRIDFLECENTRLRQEAQVRAFSEEAQLNALLLKHQAEVQELKQQNERQSQMLDSLTASAERRKLQIELDIACINMLDVSQGILERLFPGDPTVRVEATGPILRMMFEGSLQHSEYLSVLELKSIDFKVHAALDQFLELSRSLAIFIYNSNMEVTGTDLVVTAIHEPKRERRFLSEDDSRFYESLDFAFEFFCRDTKMTFKMKFSCDAGYSFPEPNFNVDCLTLSRNHGFQGMLPTGFCSLLSIFQCIIQRKADWKETSNAHLSSLGKIISMRPWYKLYGTPWFEDAECLIEQSETTCMSLAGCGCSHRRSFSLRTMLGLFEANRHQDGNGLKCPFCRKPITQCITEIGLGDISIDVSCIDIVPSDEEIRMHQEDALSFPIGFGEPVPPRETDIESQELIDRFAELALVKGVARSFAIFRGVKVEEDDKRFFFPELHDEIIDEEDPEDLEDQGDWEVPDDDDEGDWYDHGH